MRLSVIGTGYLGAVHAACMASMGHDVVGVDTDATRIELLEHGHAPFFEPGLSKLVRRGIKAGRLQFSSSLTYAAEFADVHFICVGTPQLRSGAADVSYVEAAVTELASKVKRPALIVGKSTVPVGTAARLAAQIAHLMPAGDLIEVVWNPEFLREGYAVKDTMNPDRIVVGVHGPRGADVLQEVYEDLIHSGTPYMVTDLATAELVKVAANAFLATKVSFINAMSELCEQTGADVTTLAQAVGCDPRIGSRYLHPGLGFGGGCLAKDLRAFTARADELGVGEALNFLREVDAINLRRRRRTTEIATLMLGGSVADQAVAVLGASFKPNSDDVRDSPALDVATMLQSRGASVRVHDPQAIGNARVAAPSLDYTPDITKALEGARLTLHLTEWETYSNLDPATVRDVVEEPRLLDARNALDLDRWRKEGWIAHALGHALTPRTGPEPR
jgi:UDPglucose 6-dehydrogenase